MSLGSTSESFESVATPMERGVGVIGDGGEKTREEGVGEGLDASVAPGTLGIVMVDEIRRSVRSSLAN